MLKHALFLKRQRQMYSVKRNFLRAINLLLTNLIMRFLPFTATGDNIRTVEKTTSFYSTGRCLRVPRTVLIMKARACLTRCTSNMDMKLPPDGTTPFTNKMLEPEFCVSFTFARNWMFCRQTSTVFSLEQMPRKGIRCQLRP